MTNSPQTLLELATYWTSKGGVNLGIVGNSSHCAGYHLGRDRIYSSCACKPSGECVPGRGDKDYSVQQDRDKNSLTNYASAIDLGKVNGSLVGLREFTAYLFGRGLAGDPLMHDVREVIGSTDGVNVYGWSALAPDHLIKDYGDASHKSHTHISYWRDSELRSKLPLFLAYFGETMPHIVITDTRRGVIVTTENLSLVDISDTTKRISKPKGYRRDCLGFGYLADNSWKAIDVDKHQPPTGDRGKVALVVAEGGRLYYALASQVAFTPIESYNDGVDAAVKLAATARKG